VKMKLVRILRSPRSAAMSSQLCGAHVFARLGVASMHSGVTYPYSSRLGKLNPRRNHPHGKYTY
jgi:hypothetical protein